MLGIFKLKVPNNIYQQSRCMYKNLGSWSNPLYVSFRMIHFVRMFHCGLLIENNPVGWKTCSMNSSSLLVKRTKTKKAKGKKKGGGAKVDFSIGEDIVDLRRIQSDMENSTRKLADEFIKKYSPKLSANTLDNIRVSIDGSICSLYEVAEVKTYEKEFVVTPVSDEKSDQSKIISAIKTNLNVDPRLDGQVIRIPLSVASSDYKLKIMKLAKESAEKCRVDIRKIRQQGILRMKKNDESVSKDTMKLIEKQIQLLTDIHNKEVEDMVSKKSQELDPSRK